MAYRKNIIPKSNPWQKQEAQRAAAYFQQRDNLGQPIEPLDLDSTYDDPRYSKTRRCPQGHTAHHKASVGTFVCPTCGSLLGGDGNWTPARY